jgi:hypothetical protein
MFFLQRKSKRFGEVGLTETLVMGVQGCFFLYGCCNINIETGGIN